MLSSGCLKDLLLGRCDNGTHSDSADGIRGILVLDGGVSTHLEGLFGSMNDDGAHPNNAPSFPHRELWSSSLLLNESGRSTILQGHRDWVKAGADIVSTVTYQCHYDRSKWSDVLRDCVTDETMDEMWRMGVSLAREAASESSSSSGRAKIFVAASLGCYGASLSNGAEYTGEYGNITKEDLMHFHQRRLEQALLSRPDAVAFETIPSFLECQALSELLARSQVVVDPANPCACWVSLACRNGQELNDGTPVESALDVLYSTSSELVQGIGYNCCDSRHLPRLVERWLSFVSSKCPVPQRALFLYPNSGETWCAENSTWVPGTGLAGNAEFCTMLWKCVDLIQRHFIEATPGTVQMQPLILVLGGCCRTSPPSIASLRRRVDQSEMGLR